METVTHTSTSERSAADFDLADELARVRAVVYRLHASRAIAEQSQRRAGRSELWIELQRRREAASRLPPLADGRYDPDLEPDR